MNFAEYIKESYNIDIDLFRFETRHYSQGTFITNYGDIEQYFYFIEEGIVEVEILGKKDPYIFDFLFRTEICTSYSSLITQTPSDVAIICLTDCLITKIPFRIFKEKGLSDSADIQRFLLTETNRWYLKRVQKEKDFLLLTAKERYQKILENNGELVKTVPLFKLASYLKITPESLSRIRKEVNT
ncbi:MAG: Crp/Fnr family transcriptional regulator [Bacteroidales bacterium]|jgi:CRP-like cAMP-binding protein|nr:Crp/Fnr family transcriptional regulator [Bacteroidales bacterium]